MSPKANEREQAAFENWLHDTCPSGDVTEVQRQWEASSALRSFLEDDDIGGTGMSPEQRSALATVLARYDSDPLVRPLRNLRDQDDEIQILHDVLRRNGFVRCDVPACNCGGWHARFGLPERMGEVKQLLDDAGHGLCSENGNLVSRALSDLIAERDALIAALHAAGNALDTARKAVRA